MEFHLGRLVDHVYLRVHDLDASRRFYEAALGALGRELRSGEGYFWSDELFVSDDGPPTEHLHVAFQTDGPETVGRFHEAAMAAGGRDNGGPGERSYHPGYYAAYVLDPDGTNVEAVYHGPARRSAQSVVVTPKTERKRSLVRRTPVAGSRGPASDELVERAAVRVSSS